MTYVWQNKNSGCTLTQNIKYVYIIAKALCLKKKQYKCALYLCGAHFLLAFNSTFFSFSYISLRVPFPVDRLFFFYFTNIVIVFCFVFQKNIIHCFFLVGWQNEFIFRWLFAKQKKSRRRDHTFHHKVLWKLKEITSLFSPKYINDLWLFMTVWTNVFCYSEITFSQTVTKKKNGFKRRFSFYDNNISISSSNC